MDVASAKEAMNLNINYKAITPYTLGIVLDRVGAKSNDSKCPYRIGDILLSTIPDDPKLTYPGTEWVRECAGYYLIGVDDENPDYATGGKTGGNWNHTHTIASHTHSIGAHNHGYGSLYAAIYNAGTSGHFYKTKTGVSFVANEQKKDTGAGASVNKTYTEATQIYGNTGNSTAYTSGGSGQLTTASTRLLLPYYAVYVWRRVA